LYKTLSFTADDLDAYNTSFRYKYSSHYDVPLQNDAKSGDCDFVVEDIDLEDFVLTQQQHCQKACHFSPLVRYLA
jgi:hypothetical protein